MIVIQFTDSVNVLKNGCCLELKDLLLNYQDVVVFDVELHLFARYAGVLHGKS
jgi:hypothetical protein